jgi:CO/xanthine dehydrogenase FAD-binding subunit
MGACPRPHRLTRVEQLLNGHPIDDGLIRQAAAAAEIDPHDDYDTVHACRRGAAATHPSSARGTCYRRLSSG